MKKKKTKQYYGVNKRSLRWKLASKRKRLTMLLHSCDPEKVEALFRETIGEQEIEELIEQTERELAEMSESEKRQREREADALWQKIEKTLAEEGIK